MNLRYDLHNVPLAYYAAKEYTLNNNDIIIDGILSDCRDFYSVRIDFEMASQKNWFVMSSVPRSDLIRFAGR